MLASVFLLIMLLPGGDTMTNDVVLDLVGKGVSNSLIVAMIQNSETDFDTSMETIMRLYEELKTIDFGDLKIKSDFKLEADTSFQRFPNAYYDM